MKGVGFYGSEGKTDRKTQVKSEDITFDDAETLLGYFNYKRRNKGKTSGSRVMFVSEDHQTKYCSINHIPEKNC